MKKIKYDKNEYFILIYFIFYVFYPFFDFFFRFLKKKVGVGIDPNPLVYIVPRKKQKKILIFILTNN